MFKRSLPVNGASSHVVDLVSSDDEGADDSCRQPAKRAHCTQASKVSGPIFLNRLLDADASIPGADVSLRDVFEQHPLSNGCSPHEALIANFMIDLGWLLDECPSLRNVPKLTVLHGDGGKGCVEAVALRASMGLETRMHAPELPPQWGTHHSKLAILFYDDCIRVCVRTFNDLFTDFHRKSQAMYVQDFPVKQATAAARSVHSFEDQFGKDFELQLKKYLRKCGGFDPSRLDRYDFSSAAVSLVASVPGYHQGKEASEWGHMRLRHLLRSHCRWPAPSGVADEGIICQFSSLGSLSIKWLDDFRATLASTSCGVEPTSSTVSQSPTRPPIHIVVPTVSQVRDSGEGWVAGCSIPIRRSNLKDFVRPLCRRWGSSQETDRCPEAVRARIAMPHVKSFCRYACRPGGASALAWLYIGSHNLSKAAWGELQKGGSQLCIRSYELGVLVLPSRLQALEVDASRSTGFFWRHRRSGTAANSSECRPVLVPFRTKHAGNDSGAANISTDDSEEFHVVCPTEVPPAGPSTIDDPIWAVDLEGAVCDGFDRFGRRLAECQPRFYGHRAAETRQEQEQN